jgi:hypothetical protein
MLPALAGGPAQDPVARATALYCLLMLRFSLIRQRILTLLPDDLTGRSQIGASAWCDPNVSGRLAARRVRLPPVLPPGRGAGSRRPLVLRESAEALGSLASGALSSSTLRAASTAVTTRSRAAATGEAVREGLKVHRAVGHYYRAATRIPGGGVVRGYVPCRAKPQPRMARTPRRTCRIFGRR